MGYSIKWLVEKRILYTEYYGIVDVETSRRISARIVDLMAEGQAPVHIITNQSHITGTNASPKKLIDAFKPIYDSPARGWLIYYGQKNKFVAMVTSIIAQFFVAKYRYVANLETALQFIQESDPSLENLQITPELV